MKALFTTQLFNLVILYFLPGAPNHAFSVGLLLPFRFALQLHHPRINLLHPLELSSPSADGALAGGAEFDLESAFIDMNQLFLKGPPVLDGSERCRVSNVPADNPIVRVLLRLHLFHSRRGQQLAGGRFCARLECHGLRVETPGLFRRILRARRRPVRPEENV